MVVGGDANILVIKVGGIGMFAFGNPAMAAIQTHNFHKIIRKHSLYLHRIVTEQETVINRFRCLNLCDQRNDGFPKLGEESVQGFFVQTLFILIQQSIIGSHIGIVITGKLTVKVHDLLQAGSEGRKIILIFCLFPDILCIVQQHGILHIFFRGDLLHLAVTLAQNLYLPALLVGQFILAAFQIGQQAVQFRAGFQIISDLRQNAHGLATAFPAIGRGCAGGIVKQHTHSMAISGHGLLMLSKLLKGLLQRFVIHNIISSFSRY